MTFRTMTATLFTGLCGGLLVFSILRHTVPAYLAQDHPEAALKFRPSQPDALTRLVEQVLDPQFGAHVRQPAAAAGQAKAATATAPGAPSADTSADSKPEPARASSEALGFAREEIGLAVAERMAQKAILADPLNARAYRLLGEIAARQGDEARASALMKAASRRSLHESGAQLALLRTALVKSDYAEAIANIDILLRVRPKLLPYLVPALAVMSERPEARDGVVKLLAANPPWRESFFDLLPRSTVAVETPGSLLLELKDGAAPPARAELSAYLWFLVGKKLYQDAFAYRTKFLSAEEQQAAGLVYDGDFRLQPSGLPFDWDVKSGTGYTAEVAAGYLLPGNRGLNLNFNDRRTEFRPVTQLLVLAPGRYTVKGTWRGNIVAKRGLEWQVVCADTGTVAGSSDLFHSSATEWSPFQFDVTIGEEACGAQKLMLRLDARTQSETLTDGSIWFTDLAIVKPE